MVEVNSVMLVLDSLIFYQITLVLVKICFLSLFLSPFVSSVCVVYVYNVIYLFYK